MSDIAKVWAALLFWSFLMFFIGFAIGDLSREQRAQKEIVILKIELTKLEIKKLKGLCND